MMAGVVTTKHRLLATDQDHLDRASYLSEEFEMSNSREALDEHLCQKGINVSSLRGT